MLLCPSVTSALFNMWLYLRCSVSRNQNSFHQGSWNESSLANNWARLDFVSELFKISGLVMTAVLLDLGGGLRGWFI